MSKFDQYLIEMESVNSIKWDAPLYHGTSLLIANKILKSKHFDVKPSGGVNEVGTGLYVHPSMNRTSPWVQLSTKNGKGAFIEIHFKHPLSLAIHKRNQNQRELLDSGFDGVYDKNGNTQISHQILLFNTKSLDNGVSKLNSELIDWNKTNIIQFDENKHGYLAGLETDEQKWYY
jgi:hypothetical protein